MSVTGRETEEIEGPEEGFDRTAMSAYPLDDTMVRTDSRTVGDIVKGIEAGRYATLVPLQISRP